MHVVCVHNFAKYELKNMSGVVNSMVVGSLIRLNSEAYIVTREQIFDTNHMMYGCIESLPNLGRIL